MSLVTKEGIEVKVGQLWRDMDKRMGGRVVRVYAVDSEGKATVGSWKSPSMPRTRISIKRMHKSSTGWELVTEVGK